MELEQHLSSYDHHHKKRLAEAKVLMADRWASEAHVLAWRGGCLRQWLAEAKALMADRWVSVCLFVVPTCQVQCSS